MRRVELERSANAFAASLASGSNKTALGGVAMVGNTAAGAGRGRNMTSIGCLMLRIRVIGVGGEGSKENRDEVSKDLVLSIDIMYQKYKKKGLSYTLNTDPLRIHFAGFQTSSLR